MKMETDTYPKYPIKIVFNEDSSVWILNDELELTTNLEWFDSESIDENATVTDAAGRPIILKIERLELIIFKIKHQ